MPADDDRKHWFTCASCHSSARWELSTNGCESQSGGLFDRGLLGRIREAAAQAVPFKTRRSVALRWMGSAPRLRVWE